MVCKRAVKGQFHGSNDTKPLTLYLLLPISPIPFLLVLVLRYVEVKMQIPDAAVVGNIWLQGAQSEISVAEISSADATRTITTAAYIFDTAAKSTTQSTNISTANALPADLTQAVTYGLEWKRNGNIEVSIDGVFQHRIKGKVGGWGCDDVFLNNGAVNA
jgi:hypothetical protein